MLITNEGRRVDMDEIAQPEARAKTPDRGRMASDQIPASAPSVAPRTIKKVYSRPIDTPLKNQTKTQMETLLTTLGTEFDYKSEQPEVALATSEEARKKLRIARLRKQAVAQEVNPNVINDPNAGDWQKEQTLKQIQMVREMKKRQMLSQGA